MRLQVDPTGIVAVTNGRVANDGSGSVAMSGKHAARLVAGDVQNGLLLAGLQGIQRGPPVEFRVSGTQEAVDGPGLLTQHLKQVGQAGQKQTRVRQLPGWISHGSRRRLQSQHFAPTALNIDGFVGRSDQRPKSLAVSMSSPFSISATFA